MSSTNHVLAPPAPRFTGAFDSTRLAGPASVRVERWDLPGLGTRWVASRGGRYLSATGYDSASIDGAAHHATPDDASLAAADFAASERRAAAEWLADQPPAPTAMPEPDAPAPPPAATLGYLSVVSKAGRPLRALPPAPPGCLVFLPYGHKDLCFHIKQDDAGKWVLLMPGLGYRTCRDGELGWTDVRTWDTAGEAWAEAERCSSPRGQLGDRIERLAADVRSGTLTVEIRPGDSEGETVATFRPAGEAPR